MTIVAKPVGRGRWTPLLLTYEGRQMVPLFTVAIGERFTLGGITWRVCEIKA